MDETVKKTLDVEEVRKWHRTFKRNGELFEIRILCGGGKTYSGYFTDVEKAIELLPQYDSFQIYFTVNEVKPACSSRKQFNTFMYVSGSATSKNDIEHRWWLPVDVDVERPSDVSSTDAEKEYAHKKAGEVFCFLKDCGFSSPVVCDSSSGYHIYYPIDLQNTTESETVVKSFYEVLSNFFTDDKVKIDKVVGDANRIMRLCGSWGRKGRDSSERPHRKAKILFVPETVSRMDYAFLSDFVEKYRIKEDTTKQNNYRQYNGESFDLRGFLSNSGIEVAKEMPYGNGGTKFILKECPFDSSHKAPDSAIFVTAQGAIGFKCLHNSCANHDWHELRKKFDPTAYEHSFSDAYDKKHRGYSNQKQKYEIKEEIPELGEKWLSLSSVKKIDLDELPKVQLGVPEIDRRIKGLFFGEVTVLSGSNSSGKSSWLNTVILNIIEQGYKVALWSGELQAEKLKNWFLAVAAGAHNMLPSKMENGSFYVPNNVGERIDRWLDGKFFLYNNKYGDSATQILHDINILTKAGVKVFVLDNLMTFSLDMSDGDKNEKQKNLIIKIHEFAQKENVHVIIVAHPRKSMAFLRKNDISGTADITNAVDNVFIMHRTNEDFIHAISEFYDARRADMYRQFGNVLSIEKNRMMGAVDYMCGFHYDLVSRRFKNTEYEEIHYGWERDPEQMSLPYEQTYSTQDNTGGDLPFAPPEDDATF